MKVIKVIWHFENDDTLNDEIVILNNNAVTDENIKREVEIAEGDDYLSDDINIVSWKIIANSYHDYVEGKFIGDEKEFEF